MSSARPVTRRLPATGGGRITRTVLPGGLRVVTEAVPAGRTASVGIWVPVGSRDETPALAGASHFLEHLLFKGTTTRSGLEISRALDAVGGDCNAFTEKEHTCYYATVLDRDVPLAIELVADVVLNATIAGADVEVERGVVLEEIAMRDDDPSDLVHDVFAESLFGDVPVGRPILGTEDSVQALTRGRIAGYYRRRYDPSQMVVAVAGNVEHAAVVRLVRRAFDGRLDPAAPPQPPAPRAGRVRVAAPARPVTVVGDDTEQANILLGCHALARHDPRRQVLGVLSSALGGGMSSRLFQRIREERGLAYSVYSFASSHADGGMFGVYAGCQPAKADEVVEIMTRTLDEAARDGVTVEEVERAKGQLAGSTVLSLEDAGSRMTHVGKSETAYGRVLGVDQLLARIEAVTPAQVADLAAELLTRPRCLTVVGPYGEHDFDGAVTPTLEAAR